MALCPSMICYQHIVGLLSWEKITYATIDYENGAYRYPVHLNYQIGPLMQG